MSISIAMVALVENPHLSPAEIQKDLAATWPALAVSEESAKSENTLSFRVNESDVILSLMPAPIPWEDLIGPCETSWLWPEATEELQKQKAHLIVTVSGESTLLEQTVLLSQITAAILNTCDAALGVYWCNGTLVISPELFREFAVDMLPDGFPLYIWIDFRTGPNDEGLTSGFTHGMQALGHMEFETLSSPETPGDLKERFFGLACYLLENGPIIKDGNTVGQDAHERITVNYADSSFGHDEQIMRLDYQPLNGKKPWWKVW